MVNVARVMHLAASSTTLYGVQKTLEKDGIPTARSGIRWATPVLRRMVRDDAYRTYTFAELEALVGKGVLSRDVLDSLGSLDSSAGAAFGVWWCNQVKVTKNYREDN